MPHEREETIIKQALVETDPADEVELPDKVGLADGLNLATKEIRIQADMSGGKGSPSLIEFGVSRTIFERAKQVLEEKGIKPIQIGEAVVFAVAVTAVGTVAAKKIIERRQEKKRLEEEAQIPHLTEEQEAKFTTIFESFFKKIYGYIYYRVGNAQDAEDLTCKVFTKALVAFPGFIPDEKLPNPHLSWLYRIAHNTLANYWRDKRTETEVSEDILTTLFSDESEEPPDEMEMLRQVYNSLSDLDKSVIWLKLVEKLSNEDIAYILDKSEGAIKSLFHRILRDKIEPRVLQRVERNK